MRQKKSDGRMLGASLADVFRAPEYDCRIVGPDNRPEFAVTRLRSGPREMEQAPKYPADEAILICVSLTPTAVGQWKAIYDGREVGVTRAIPFATTFLDLGRTMTMWVRGPFDYLHYYLPFGLLRRIAADNAIAPDLRLRDSFFIEDLVVAELTKSILIAVTHAEPLDRLALDQIAMVLGAHVLQTHCGMAKFAAAPRRGLESWQKLRTEEMLRANLQGNISVKELAGACSLSESHFARCFRRTFGIPVHQRLIQLRLEHSRDLLLRTPKTLAEIALLSGFCDQAAFARAFNRTEGVTPSRWRRLNISRTPAPGISLPR